MSPQTSTLTALLIQKTPTTSMSDPDAEHQPAERVVTAA